MGVGAAVSLALAGLWSPRAACPFTHEIWVRRDGSARVPQYGRLRSGLRSRRPGGQRLRTDSTASAGSCSGGPTRDRQKAGVRWARARTRQGGRRPPVRSSTAWTTSACSRTSAGQPGMRREWSRRCPRCAWSAPAAPGSSVGVETSGSRELGDSSRMADVHGQRVGVADHRRGDRPTSHAPRIDVHYRRAGHRPRRWRSGESRSEALDGIEAGLPAAHPRRGWSCAPGRWSIVAGIGHRHGSPWSCSARWPFAAPSPHPRIAGIASSPSLCLQAWCGYAYVETDASAQAGIPPPEPGPPPATLPPPLALPPDDARAPRPPRPASTHSRR